jgi:hypothetical protein
MAKAASAVATLAGLWLFVSPWVYGATMNGDAWNNWIVGSFMVLFGFTQLARPADSGNLSWCNLILGLWTLVSPWIYGYTATSPGRFLNSLGVGTMVFLFSLTSAWVGPHRTAPPQR